MSSPPEETKANTENLSAELPEAGGVPETRGVPEAGVLSETGDLPKTEDPAATGDLPKTENLPKTEDLAETGDLTKPENLTPPADLTTSPSLPDLIQSFLQAVAIADNDPESRMKLLQLDRSAEKAFNSKSANAAKYLMLQYQNSPIQKLVDSGVDYAEKIMKITEVASRAMIDTAFDIARKKLAVLKNPNIKGSARLNKSAEKTKESASSAAEESTTKESAALDRINPELTPPLHKMLDIYQQIVKALVMGENEAAETEPKNLFEQMKTSYQASPTLQKIVVTGLNFAEKISLRLSDEKSHAEIKQGLDNVKSLCKQWARETQQARLAKLQPDVFEPVRVEKVPPLAAGSKEPVTHRSYAQVASTSKSPKISKPSPSA